MASPESRPRTIRFGSFELDAVNRELRKLGNVVKLQPQQFAVLLMLVEHAGHLVSRDEIRERVWDTGTFVDFERSINFAINQIRVALKDDIEHPRFIETLPKRGYRFIAAIEDDRLDAGAASGPIFIDRKAIAPPPRERITPPAHLLEAGEAAGPPIVRARPMDESEEISTAPAPTRSQSMPGSALRLRVLVGGVFLLSAAFAIFLWFRIRLSEKPEIKEQQLTRNSNDNPISFVAVSGDGKYLAFTDVSGLHVKLVQTGEVHDLPQPPEFGKSHVHWGIHWLPDSTRFLAVSFPIGEPPSTWQASVVGGVLRILRNDALAWSISPDGSLIAFTTADEREMWLMGIGGESPRKLGDAGENNWFTHVEWSPDGDRLLYIKLSPSRGSLNALLETRDLKGGTTSTLLSDTRLRSVNWLHDGRILLVLGEPGVKGDTCNYWVARLDSSGGAFSAKPTPLTHNIGFCIGSTSATADGKQLVFLKRTSEYSVYVADLQPGATGITPPKHLTLTEGQEFPAAWTADSQAVIFVSNRDGKWGFYRQPLTGDAASPILTGMTSDGLGAIFPRVSPDGKWLVYAPYPPDHIRGATMELLKVPITGGTPQLILKAPMYDTPRCAQAPAQLCAVAIVDKDRLIFTSFDPVLGRGRELARFKLDDTNKSYGWALSPDGARIAIIKQSTAEIHVLSLQTNADQKIIVQGWNSLMALDWTSDGTGLFTSSLQPSCVVLRVDLHGNARVLWEPKGVNMTWAIPSPDGRHLAMPAFFQNSNVWTMENF